MMKDESGFAQIVEKSFFEDESERDKIQAS
jgi:hypothetical protein